jgi:hypothetical protein
MNDILVDVDEIGHISMIMVARYDGYVGIDDGRSQCLVMSRLKNDNTIDDIVENDDGVSGLIFVMFSDTVKMMSDRRMLKGEDEKLNCNWNAIMECSNSV